MNTTFMFSVVIPAKNEQDYLPELLESIKKQKLQPDEIIVADAESEDSTVEIAQEYGCRVVKGGGYAVGRNRGAQEAKSEILLFIDADCVLPNDMFFNRIIGEFIKKGADLASCLFFPSESKTVFTLPMAGINAIKAFTAFINTPTNIGGACIIMHSRVFDELGGFNENLHAREDRDFFRRAFARDMEFVVLPTIIKTSMRRFKRKPLANTFVLEGLLDVLKTTDLKDLKDIGQKIDRIVWYDATPPVSKD